MACPAAARIVGRLVGSGEYRWLGYGCRHELARRFGRGLGRGFGRGRRAAMARPAAASVPSNLVVVGKPCGLGRRGGYHPVPPKVHGTVLRSGVRSRSRSNYRSRTYVAFATACSGRTKEKDLKKTL